MVVPEFLIKSIQQSTPVSSAINTLTITLIANYNLASRSRVTISGLTGSMTSDSASLPVSSTSGSLGTTGTWTKGSGQLVLLAASGGMAAGTACEVTLALNNPSTPQPSASVTVAAVIEDGSNNTVGAIAESAITKPGSALYGIDKGTDPLRWRCPSSA